MGGKPYGELGRLVATLVAFGTILQIMGVAKEKDIHALRYELQETRYRLDVFMNTYQAREGVTIFNWRDLEPPDIQHTVDPVGPLPERTQ